MFELFSTADFPARWFCGRWSDVHGWTHVASDVAIFSAYAAIPAALFYFARRRRDVPFVPVFWLFGAFIFFCGFGHLVEATLFWQPWYRFSALVKVCTALVSWATVIALIRVLPSAVKLPGLAAVNAELEEANRDLRRFVDSVSGREERMIELKQEVNALLRELGREPQYASETAA
jgi:hypothetical protein